MGGGSVHLRLYEILYTHAHMHADPQTHTHTYTHSLEIRILLSNTVGHLPTNIKSVINAFKKS